MKKIIYLFIFLLISSYIFSTNASFINLESTQTFYPSEGIVESRPITINISDYTNVNFKDFSLILPEDSNIRFSSDFSSIIISGKSSQKVGTGITIMPNLRELKFELFENFANEDSITITGLKLIAYSKPQGDRYIGVDLNGDNVVDAISANGYRINTTNAYSDTLAPSEVFNFTGSIIDNKITVSADMPGDVDFQAIVLENLDNTGKVLSSFFRYDLNNFTYDLQLKYDSIRIKAVDVRANYSNGLTYNLDLFRAKEEPITPVVPEQEVCIQVISYAINPENGICETFSTPCLIPEGYSKVDKCEEINVEKYVPTFTRFDILYNVTRLLDRYLTKNLSEDSPVDKVNKLTTIRNNLVIILERFDVAPTRVELLSVAEEFKALFKEFKIEVQ